MGMSSFDASGEPDSTGGAAERDGTGEVDGSDAEGESGVEGRFGEVADRYDPETVEERVFEHWEETDAYRKTKAHRAGNEPFFFVDGPPYTSGSAHMGHAWNKTLKDVYVRYHRMCGYDVTDRPGYDMHGLPVETKVEEELGFESKKDIEAYGEEAFIEACREYAETQLAGLQSDFQSLGVWMNWENPYRTVTPEYMEAAWWAFAQVHERGLVERGGRSINQCPRCETAIANNEVERHDVHKPAIHVRFDLVDREGALVIWTTTPWTIPGNAFVAVEGDAEYVGVRAEKGGEEELLYVSRAGVESVLEAGGYEEHEIIEELAGEELVGWRYEHPLADAVPEHHASEGTGEVYTAGYADAEDQSGLVHSAPGHGEEDFERGTELGIEAFSPVAGDGTFTAAAGRYAGQFVRDANADIVADLDERGLLLAHDPAYLVEGEGQCWRCGTDIVRIVTDQWFITITDVKEELLANVDDAEWYPEWARENRFRDFVADAPDWNVSRQRYWGIPIPIWLPEGAAASSDAAASAPEGSASGPKGGASAPAGEDAGGDPGGWSGAMDDAIVVGDRAELAARVDQDVDPETIDLHKDTVDDLTITEDGTTYTRVPDVFDVWLDSSVATWGTIGFPGRTDDHERLWPADLVVEAHDQTRGWFWSQLGMGTAAVGECPYEQVLMHGYANMPDGRGMSKSKGISIDPIEVCEEYGTDPLRLFLLSVTPRGEDMCFSYEETEEMQRRLNILWNVARFPLPYMRADGFDPAATTLDEVDADLELLDTWVLSRLGSVEASVTEQMDAFANERAVAELLEFVVEDVSRYYLQAVRDRVWEEEESRSKRAAYATLYRVLDETVRLFAPFAPLVAEEIYGTLTGDAGHPTVHMCDWPTPDAERRDPELEREVAVARAIEEAGSNARQQAGRKLRWPVERVVVDADSEDVTAAIESRRELVADRLNARSVGVVAPEERWGELRYGARADMSVLGPAFGERADRVVDALNDARVVEPTLDALEAAVGETLGEPVELTDEMVAVRVEPPEGVAGAAFECEAGTGTVYVDTALTEDVESEGYARDVVRRVQEMRKELDLDVEASIRLDLAIPDERVAALVGEHEALIAEEVRAGEFGDVEDGHRREWEIEGVAVEIAIEPLAEARA
jgi:isoleucyl-tRNA synthetase